MLFPVINSDDYVQINDQFRIDVSKSYIAGSTADFDSILVYPEGPSGIFTDVYIEDEDEWFLDWQYSASGIFDVTVVCFDTDANSATGTLAVSGVTPDQDYLYSDDDDLRQYETDIMKWLPVGRASYKYVHRAAQKVIMEYLDRNGYTNSYHEKYVKTDIIDRTETREWSQFIALRMIFDNLSNSNDDIFFRKARYYAGLETKAESRFILRIDTNKDGNADYEGIHISSGSLIV